MQLVIQSNKSLPINFAPNSLVDEIAQNVRTILNTVKYSVPLDRDFGISVNIVDAPIAPSIEAQLYSDVLDVIRTYEPRVNLEALDIKSEIDGELYVEAVIMMKGVNE